MKMQICTIEVIVGSSKVKGKKRNFEKKAKATWPFFFSKNLLT